MLAIFLSLLCFVLVWFALLVCFFLLANFPTSSPPPSSLTASSFFFPLFSFSPFLLLSFSPSLLLSFSACFLLPSSLLASLSTCSASFFPFFLSSSLQFIIKAEYPCESAARDYLFYKHRQLLQGRGNNFIIGRIFRGNDFGDLLR